MKDTLTQKYQVASHAILVIPPAIDTHFFMNEHPNPNTEVLQLTTIARLHWKKGLSYTLEALALLKHKGILFHYTIIGDGDEMERLVFAVHQLGLKEEVSFLGKVSQDEVKAQLEITDIYLQYSIQEGFCNAVLEAQAMGLLCIVSNAEGLSENVLDGQTGWVVPKRQPEVLASKIVEVMQLPEAEKTHIRQKAIGRVRAEFHLEQQQAAFLKFYTE
jgi:colanic acid/amylovoran biosynthesis glycosyltransferase